MTNLEKIEKIEEAISLVEDAYKIVKEVVKGSGIAHDFYAGNSYDFKTLLGNSSV